MSIKTKIFIVILLSTMSIAFGQSDIILTQQWFSRINMNPAATGHSNHVDVFLLNRQQWTGFSNAPRTTLLNAHSYFSDIRSGLGISLMMDRIGVSNQTMDAMLSYAYHMNLTDDVLLSLGLSGGMYNNRWDPMQNSLSEQSDPELDVERTSRTAADFHTGMELTGYGMTVGASITHLLNSTPENSFSGKPGREFYAYARYLRALGRDFEIAPALMYRNGNRSNLFEYSVTGYYQKKYWAGLSFRPKRAFSVMLGATYGMFRVGYAYDRSVGAISLLAANTHEFMLSIRLQKPQKGRETNRFFDY